MAEKYQTLAKKPTKKFEVLGRKELAMSVPLPLVEVWEDLQPEVEHLTGVAGLKIIQALIEDEVTWRVGPRHHPDDTCAVQKQTINILAKRGCDPPIRSPNLAANGKTLSTQRRN
jgi:hypothetical protein